ncbi:MAG: VRR-NUC domain-containing protein, partial [Bdellovibrionota bacterium]
FEALKDKRFLEPAELDAEALSLLKIPELKALAKSLGLPSVTSLKKDELVDLLLPILPTHKWQETGVYTKVLADINEVARAFFFGDFQSDVFSFIKGDVLKLSLEKFESQFEMAFKFEAEEEFKAAIEFFALRTEMYNIMNLVEPDVDDIANLKAIFAQMKVLPLKDARLIERRSKYYYKTGHTLERNSHDDVEEAFAYDVLSLSNDERAEQKCLAYWLRQEDKAKIENFFAVNSERVLNDPKWNKFLPSFVKRAKKIDIHIDLEAEYDLPTDTYELKKDGPIEDNLCRYFEDQGLMAHHLENYSVRLLFMLYFWDIIFTSLPGVFRHQFQAGPDDFFDKDKFYQNRKALCDERLKEIELDAISTDQIIQRLKEKKDFINPLAQLSWLEEDLLKEIITGLTGQQLAGIFRNFLKDIRTFSAGFPDLVVIDRAKKICSFIEVKGPGDTLRPVQIEWLESLIAAGIDARVAKVVYT